MARPYRESIPPRGGRAMLGGMTKNADTTNALPASVRAATWAVRAAYLVVFVVNVQCAISFIVNPSGYAGAYELSGVPGEVAVQGIGVAFLMWNVTYPAVIASPRRFRALGVVVLVQQAIGLVGESLILAGLPAGHDVLAASIERFIAFDAFGLVVMAATFAVLLLVEHRSSSSRNV